MIRQINVDMTKEKAIRFVVLYDDNIRSRPVKSFNDLTEEEKTFFKENAENMWWFGGANEIDTYIVNPCKGKVIC